MSQPGNPAVAAEERRRMVVVGGTRFVGPATVRLAHASGWDVAVAHTGTHEPEAPLPADHLHGSRERLLAPGGPVERWAPDAIVDTFAGGATAAKAREVVACARRAGARRVVAIGSVDVYQHVVNAGIGNGTSATLLAEDPLPLTETSRVRDRAYPGSRPSHDNAQMEAAFAAEDPVTILRCGTIYGVDHPEPHRGVREWSLVRRIARGERHLPIPNGGNQILHRVAVERVARAAVAAATASPAGRWACNVVDPYDWTYGGLAREIAEILHWRWEPQAAPFHTEAHPWAVAHPVLCSDERLRHVLGVVAPDPREALAAAVEWLWDRREELLSLEEERGEG